MYSELAERGVEFRPPVYLSDQWGCPDGTPLIGVPFYLADKRLERIEAEQAGAVEGDEEAMRYLRHEAGHAVNYAFRLYDRADFANNFGDYARPYRERYAADPLSRDYVRHILGWYAQKHPDEDFAETFAVWLTPTLDWRREYEGWGALRKLEWMDGIMREIGPLSPAVPQISEDDLPVEAMDWTVSEHYAIDEELFPLEDGRQFDGDLLRVFARRDRLSGGRVRGALSQPARRRVGDANRLLDGRSGADGPSAGARVARSRCDARPACERTGGSHADRADRIRYRGDDALAIHARRARPRHETTR